MFHGANASGRKINSFLWQSNKYLYIKLSKDLHQKGLRGKKKEKKKVQSFSGIYNLKTQTGKEKKN